MKTHLQRHWTRVRGSRRVAAARRRLAAVLRRAARWGAYGALAAGVLAAAFYAAVAWIVMPRLVAEKAAIERYLSQRSGYQVRIQGLAGYWDGLRPGLHLQDLKVYAADATQPAVRLDALRISPALLPLLRAELAIHTLVVSGPRLAVERLADGRFRITGLSDAAAPDGADPFIAWLFRQDRLVIEQGELQWFDHQEPDKALYLRDIRLSLRNRGSRHRFTAEARFPQELCAECAFAAEFDGNPLFDATWDGWFSVRAYRLDVERLPQALRRWLPPQFRGRFTVDLESDWAEAGPWSVHGTVAVDDLSVLLPGARRPLAVKQARGAVRWRAREPGWRLDLSGATLQLATRLWPAGRLRVDYRPEASVVELEHLDLDEVTAFLRRARPEAVAPTQATAVPEARLIADLWEVLAPGGQAHDVRLRLQGPLAQPQDFAVDARLADVRLAAYQTYPGVSGLSGHLSMRPDHGRLALDAHALSVSLPQEFRAPFEAARASGDLRWERKADHWAVSGEDLRVSGGDAQGKGRLLLRLPHAQDEPLYLRLRVDFRNGRGENAPRYYPVRHLPPRVLEWADQAFLGGRVTEGFIVFDGHPREFPFRNGRGRFQIEGHVRDGVYRYLPGWMPITDAEVDVSIRNEKVLITGTGRIGGLELSQAVVATELGREQSVRVSGRASGSVEDAFTVLRTVKGPDDAPSWQAWLPRGLEAGGQGTLSLDITVPPEAGPPVIAGEYKLIDASLRYVGGPGIDEIYGTVAFDGHGPRAGGLRGRLLGGTAELSFSTPAQGVVHAAAQGSLPAGAAVSLFAPLAARQVQGAVPWELSWQEGDGPPRLVARLDLSQLRLDLPPPLDLAQGLGPVPLVIETAASRSDWQLLRLAMGEAMRGRLALRRGPNGWGVEQGEIALGVPPPREPSTQGLHVSARIARLDADRWLALTDDTRAGMTEWLQRLSLDVGSLVFLDRDFGRLALDLRRDKQGWSGAVAGTNAAGRIELEQSAATPRVALDFTMLQVPERMRTGAARVGDPRKMPWLQLRSRALQLKDLALGELELHGVPDGNGWRVSRFRLARPDLTLDGSGEWRMLGGRETSRFRVELASGDFGGALTALGLPEQMSGGRVQISSQLEWSGPPTAIGPEAVEGRIAIKASKGQFPQVKQGASRLFGLVDLSAIARYLTLDFSPIFGKGLIYDEISGSLRVERGNAYTEDLAIASPTARIGMSGRVGIAAEDFDLVIDVFPELSTGISLATWGIWGPQVAAAVLAIQKLFKKQIAEGTRVTYVVKGPWEDPDIKRLTRGEVSAAPGSAEVVRE